MVVKEKKSEMSIYPENRALQTFGGSGLDTKSGLQGLMKDQHGWAHPQH